MEPRRSLGRGLASLIPAGPVVVTPPAGRVYQEVAIDAIRPPHSQPRKTFDAAKIDELARSIKAKGVLLPLLVRTVPGGYELISGERRLRAARQLGLATVPVLVRDVAPQEQLELALIENLQRADLDPIEEGRGYADLIERFGMTQEEVAAKVGRDRATVANALRLLKLPEKVQAALKEGGISVGHAKLLLPLPIDHQLQLTSEIRTKGWSVRELERQLARLSRPSHPERPGPPPLSPALAGLAERLRAALGTLVHLQPGRGEKGKLVIEYYSTAQLAELCQRLNLGGD